MKVLIIILVLLFCYVMWQKWELTKFQVTAYQISSPKIKEKSSVAVIADLHGFSYGRKNERLLRQIKDMEPQAILIAGDMLVSRDRETFPTALDTLRALTEIGPVYYSYGNHETRLRNPEKINHPFFMEYMDQVKESGVHVMETESREILLGKNSVMLSSLELELEYYEKGTDVLMEEDYMEQHLPMKKPELFQILLAHNPAYAEYYAEWGADVTFCGHNHGGLIRIPGIGSLISPQLTWFPKHDAGRFQIAGKDVVVSRGMGTHTFHIRIFNRAELLKVIFLPDFS